MHVASGVDMNQAADAGDDEDHHGGKRVDHKGHIHFQRAEIDPAIKVVDQKALFGFEPFQDKKSVDRKAKGDHHRCAGDQANGALAHALLDLRAQQPVDDRPDQGQENDPADKICLYRIVHLNLDLAFEPLNA